MRLVTQPEGSSLCGQACVAMVADISLEKAIKTMGTKGATSTKQVVAALKEHGVICGDLRRVSKKRPIPNYVIAHTHFGVPNRSHWVVRWSGLYFDPDPGSICFFLKLPLHVTSYLPILFSPA